MYNFKNSNKKNAFTLVELLVVLGTLSIILAIVLVAVNPAKHFEDANYAKRQSDLTSLLNAINQYSIDNEGSLIDGINSSEQIISSDNLDICTELVTLYLAEMPYDSDIGYYEDCDNYNTGYSVYSADNNRIVVKTTNNNIQEISISR